MPSPPVFRSSALWAHFVRHKKDFGVTTEIAYQDAAREFLTKPLNNPMSCRYNPKVSCSVYGPIHECICHGDVVRYNTQTQEFGVLGADGYLSTYMKPDPAITGKVNLKYFHDRCIP